ncbi:MAG: hypothetical protein ABH950_05930 [Candidatus Altiarchaeota archaeon]
MSGFGEVATQLILFIAIMGIVAGLVVYFNFYISETKGAMGDQKNYIKNQLRTEITIPTVYYKAQAGNDDIWVYTKNVGKTNMKTSCITLFVDNQDINLAATDIIFAGNRTAATLWRPDETLLLNASGNLDLAASQVFEVLIATCTGVTDSFEFST